MPTTSDEVIEKLEGIILNLNNGLKSNVTPAISFKNDLTKLQKELNELIKHPRYTPLSNEITQLSNEIDTIITSKEIFQIKDKTNDLFKTRINPLMTKIKNVFNPNTEFIHSIENIIGLNKELISFAKIKYFRYFGIKRFDKKGFLTFYGKHKNGLLKNVEESKHVQILYSKNKELNLLSEDDIKLLHLYCIYYTIIYLQDNVKNLHNSLINDILKEIVSIIKPNPSIFYDIIDKVDEQLSKNYKKEIKELGMLDELKKWTAITSGIGALIIATNIARADDFKPLPPMKNNIVIASSQIDNPPIKIEENIKIDQIKKVSILYKELEKSIKKYNDTKNINDLQISLRTLKLNIDKLPDNEKIELLSIVIYRLNFLDKTIKYYLGINDIIKDLKTLVAKSLETEDDTKIMIRLQKLRLENDLNEFNKAFTEYKDIPKVESTRKMIWKTIIEMRDLIDKLPDNEQKKSVNELISRLEKINEGSIRLGIERIIEVLKERPEKIASLK